MTRWTVYIYERFPPLVYGSLALGIALSGSHLNGAGSSFYPTLLAFIGIWTFLFCLRISNDINDIAKDRIAFPNRPLPAGTIKILEAKQLLFFLQLLLFAYSQLVWVSTNGTAALAFLLLACWAWFSDKRFFLKNFLVRAPYVAVFLNPLFIIPTAFFAVSVAQPMRVLGVKSLSYAALLYGAMLAYNLCRKLNPHIHPIEAAFIHFYGFKKTFYLLLAALIISAIGASFLGVGGLLWPVQFILFGTLLSLFYQPQQYQLPEMASAVSLIVHAWAGIF